MTELARKEARLKLIALIQELPLEADLSLNVRQMSREEYDLMPGANEVTVGQGRGRSWSKDLEGEGVTVELWTDEPPATVVGLDTHTTRTELRLVDGGAA